MLLERLLLRMGMTSGATQRRYLAFCVSELNITEKGVRRMLELVRCIKDALYDSEVFDAFKLTVSRAKKGVGRGAAAAAVSTTEAKSAVEEFEAFMQSVRDGASGDDATAMSMLSGDGDQNELQSAEDAPARKGDVRIFDGGGKKLIFYCFANSRDR